jgi:hypothetical protein
MFRRSRPDFISDISVIAGKVIDCGRHRIYETLDDTMLTGREETRGQAISRFESMFEGPDMNLYAIARSNDLSIRVYRLEQDGDRYRLGEAVQEYGIRHNRLCQAIHISDGRSRSPEGIARDFSILSTAYQECLDIDGIKVEGTQVPRGQRICRAISLCEDADTALIAYSGNNIGAVLKAEIDLRTLTAKAAPLIGGLSHYVNALEPVRSRKLHEMLISHPEAQRR